MDGATQLFGVSAMAQHGRTSEGTVRRLEAQGVIKAIRDSAGRRQFTRDQADKLRAYVSRRRSA